MSHPDWLVPGAPVAVVSEGHRGTAASIKLTTVDRVLKRDVVLANGDRFNVDRLQRSIGAWGQTTYLVQRHDPKALRAHERVVRDNTVRAVGEEMRSWKTTGDRCHPQRALEILQSVLDELERGVGPCS